MDTDGLIGVPVAPVGRVLPGARESSTGRQSVGGRKVVVVGAGTAVRPRGSTVGPFLERVVPCLAPSLLTYSQVSRGGPDGRGRGGRGSESGMSFERFIVPLRTPGSRRRTWVLPVHSGCRGNRGPRRETSGWSRRHNRTEETVV